MVLSSTPSERWGSRPLSLENKNADSERILDAQENPLRSLLIANEEGIYRSATPKTPLRSVFEKTQIAEGIFCQTRRRVRSLLDVNEELAYRSAVKNSPVRCVFFILRRPQHASLESP